MRSAGGWLRHGIWPSPPAANDSYWREMTGSTAGDRHPRKCNNRLREFASVGAGVEGNHFAMLLVPQDLVVQDDERDWQPM